MQTDLTDVPKEELDIILQQIYAEAHKRAYILDSYSDSD